MPQSLFETKPEVLRIIEAEERAGPRARAFSDSSHAALEPAGMGPDQLERIGFATLVSWERDTLQPKYGINLGVEYTHTIGVAELYDYEWYFNGFLRTVRTAEVAKSLGVEVGKEVVYFPSPGFRHVEHPVLRLALLPRRLARRVPRIRLVLVPERGGLSRARTIPRARWHR